MEISEMASKTHRLVGGLAVVAFGLVAAPAWAQGGPWAVFIDSQSGSECGIINADNAELVMLDATRELVVVTAADRVLPGSFVNSNGDVTIDGEVIGSVAFATDGDGYRTLWWLTLTGRAIQIDDLTLEPSVSDHVPADLVDVPCDACDFWDDPSVCEAPATSQSTLGLCGSGVGTTTLSLSLASLVGLRLVRSRRRM